MKPEEDMKKENKVTKLDEQELNEVAGGYTGPSCPRCGNPSTGNWRRDYFICTVCGYEF